MDVHFHDLRHTWASWHVQAGTPLMVLKQLGGREHIEMVQKYAHLAPTHLGVVRVVKRPARSQDRLLDPGQQLGGRRKCPSDT